MNSSLLSQIAAREPEAMARFYDDHAGSVRQFCATVCPPYRLEEAVAAAFVNFLGRTAEAGPNTDPRDLLHRATREAAASRIEVESRLGSRPASQICLAAPELLASRANGELPRADRPLLKHIRGCETFRTTEAML